jgi:UDP-glucose 4-epimerase
MTVMEKTETIDVSSSFAGKKVMITGGLGFIGSNLALRLLDLGAEVLVVDSLIPQYGGNRFNLSQARGKLQINISDVRDTYGFEALLEGQDYLFNLAGQTSHMDSMSDPDTDLQINCRAQLAILEACRKHNPTIKIVFASTRQIYGEPDYLPVDEAHPLRPVDVNGINKMAGEWYHILYNNVYGISGCALRLTNTIGPRMRVCDARQTFLGIWIRLLLEGKSFEVWGGEQLRDFNYVDDVVEAFLRAAACDDANGKIFNLGHHDVVPLSELGKMLIVANGNQGEFKVCQFPADRKRIDIGDYYADYRLAQRVLGWEPRTSLQEALNKTLAFYKENLHEYV